MESYNLKVGIIINDRYKLLEYLGEGTHSIVFKSFDILLERTVALKFQELDFKDNYEIEFQSLLKEAKIISKLSHPNILQIYDCGVLKDLGLAWMSTQFLKGETLRKLIELHHEFSYPELIDISLKIAEAIDYCHSKHKFYQLDIKPGNVMYNHENGKVSLIDFGSLNTQEDKSKYPFGTPEYLSPELLLGYEASFESDIYSYGLMLYELFTNGKNPLYKPYSEPRTVKMSSIDAATCALGISIDFHNLNNSLEKSEKLKTFNPVHELSKNIHDNRMIDVICGCLAFDYEKRFNSHQLVSELKRIEQNLDKGKLFDVFISYKSEDISLAEGVFQLLKNNGHNPFLSKESLPSLGESDYLEAIYSAINETKHFILVSSSIENIKSKWVKAEWSAFINEKLAGRKNGNIISIISQNLKITDLPLVLRQYEAFVFNDIKYDKLKSYLQ